MQFNRQNKVDFKQWNQVKMERENNLKEFKATVGEDLPLYGAGSEFGRERREEARKKKFGVRVQKYKEEDQPWILKLGGKQGKKFRGRKEGLVAENSSYYVFKQLPDSTFEAYPVDSFYNFMPMIQYRTLNAEEAEEEFGRRDRTMNYFSMMLQRRLKDQTEGDEKAEKPEKRSSSQELTITEDDEFQNLLLSEDEEGSDDDSPSERKKGSKKDDKGAKGKKKKKQVEDEAEEESDEGDFDARELDYISEESSEGEAEIEEKHDIKGIDQELQKIEDEEEENEENEEADEEGEDPSKEDGEIPKEKKNGESDFSQSDSSDSDIDDSKIQSPFFMQKKPAKKSSNKSSSRSSTGPSSRSNTPTPSDTTKTLSDAASKLQKETVKRPFPSSSSDIPSKVKRTESDLPKSLSSAMTSEKVDPTRLKSENVSNKFQAIKRPHGSSGEHHSAKKMRTGSPVPRSQTGTPPSEQGITEEVVRRYLLRKPMQTKDLLYKLNPKKVGLSKDEVVKRLTEVLKRLNPDKIRIKDKNYWTIKSDNQKAGGV